LKSAVEQADSLLGSECFGVGRHGGVLACRDEFDGVLFRYGGE
jgi:hypothetical protein